MHKLFWLYDNESLCIIAMHTLIPLTWSTSIIVEVLNEDGPRVEDVELARYLMLLSCESTNKTTCMINLMMIMVEKYIWLYS